MEAYEYEVSLLSRGLSWMTLKNVAVFARWGEPKSAVEIIAQCRLCSVRSSYFADARSYDHYLNEKPLHLVAGLARDWACECDRKQPDPDTDAQVRRGDTIDSFELDVAEDRRKSPRCPGKFRFFHGGIEHHCIWNQTLPVLDSDGWIEVVW